MSSIVEHGNSGPYVLQADAVSGAGAALVCGNAGEIGVYIVGSAGVTAGVVQLETAATDDYDGQWAPLGQPVTVVPGETIVEVEGPLAALRARIETPITGGAVSVQVFVGF